MHKRAGGILAMDVCGGVLTAAGLAAGMSLLVIHHPHVDSEIDGHRARIARATLEREHTRSELDAAEAKLAVLKQTLAEGGFVIPKMPVEEYFKNLAGLASFHGLEILGQNPLSPRTYPGLLEQRHALELKGEFPKLLQFFRDMEDIDFWADISYLRLNSAAKRQDEEQSNERVASLTISIFSTLPSESGTPNAP